MLNHTNPEEIMADVIEISFAGNAVWCEVTGTDVEKGLDAIYDETGTHYAGYRESYPLGSDRMMIVLDRH